MPASSSPARGPLGRLLDRLYDATAALGAVAMVLLLAMVLLSVTSRQIGFNVAGIDAYAGYSCKLAWQSYVFHDVSTSNDATPLWLPQIAMALGAIVLAIAFIDELVLEIRGLRVVPVSDEATRNE